MMELLTAGRFGPPVERDAVDPAVLASDEFSAYEQDEVTVMRHRLS